MAPTSHVVCPRCAYRFSVPAAQRHALVACPDCGRLFQPPTRANRHPRGDGSRPSLLPRDRKTYLTAPHPCHPGKHPINKAFGHRQTTIRCDECLGTTSIYAAIYFCPSCTKRQTLLESPKSQWGQTTICPSCEATLTVPNDDTLREIDPARRDGTWFSFPCPACDAALACAVRHSGTWAVCLHCGYAIQVPRAGNRVEPAVSNDLDTTRQAVQAGGNYPCPGCGMRIPKGCHRCPHCRDNL